ncbi:MAG: GGDEF domain-containing phosphodiesterase [Neomegalonema sp.]|nr:GGDEF domain-containing phosphodiesterase [Neomegalonema sp.]
MNADIALYKAKSGGRNRVEVYTSALQHALVAQKQRSDELLSALEAGEIGAYFQPQFNASDLEYVGLEALARWEHPERGVLPPCAFFDIAEELQIVDEIDRVVMAKAAEMCRVLAAAGISTPKIAVNVSCDRLKRDLIYEDVANFDAAGAQLAFELLETIYVEGDEDLDSSIQRLRRLGVEFEVDDFGSGRASILSLLHVTPRRLKIDRALIEPIVESPKHLQVVRAIVEIGRSQGVSVTAEGVETEAHVEILRDLGCDTLQGYYFSAPMSPERLTRYLQTRQWLKAS